MDRRAWLKHAFDAGVASWLLGITAGRGFSAARRTLPATHVWKTLAALAETILPAVDDVPGANGAFVVRLIQERTAADAEWLRFYSAGARRLDAFARGMSRRSFAEMAPAKRSAVLSEFWASTEAPSTKSNQQAQLFLQTLKQDALNEVFTTRKGLSWLGYKGNVHLSARFAGCPGESQR